MNLKDHESRQFDELLERLCEQQLSEADRRLLEERLRQGEPWRSRYLAYIDLHATLWLSGGNGVPGVSEAGDSMKRLLALKSLSAVGSGDSNAAESPVVAGGLQDPARGAPVRVLFRLGQSLVRGTFSLSALVLFASTLTLGGLGGKWLYQRKAEVAVPELAALTNGSPAAYLMSANGCNWRGTPPTYAVGSGIQAGDEISLLEGVAEFRLASGVGLSVEGPANMLLASPSTLVLQRGKLVTNLPWGVADFKAIVGGYRIVARDAEFGIDCSSQKLAIHVFSGEVICDPPPVFVVKGSTVEEDEEFADEKRSFPAPVKIRGSYAVEFAPDSQGAIQQRNVPLDTKLFAAKLPMNGALPITKEYISAVKSSQPLCYWRFESVENGKIRNEVKNAPAIRVENALSLPGDETNHVVDLGPSSYQAMNFTAESKINLMETGNFSVELWVKPSHFHRGAMVRMAAGATPGFALETLPAREARPTGHPGTVHFYHRTPSGDGKRSLGVSCFSSNLYSIRQWQHVVAVKKGGYLRLYLDGKESGTRKNTGPGLPRELDVVIGRRFSRERYDEENRFFVGQLDELAIYSRALTKQEIADHFKAVDFKGPTIKSVSSPDI